jgi:histidine triad (HIT) family protein
MTTVFSRIIAGEIPGTFVWTDPDCVAFMSINPINTGHVLVVPRLEVDEWTDLPALLVAHLSTVAQTIGRAQKVAFDCERIGLIIAGFEVPHVHLHVIPTNGMQHMSFANAAATPDFAAINAAAQKIIDALT